MIFKTPPHIKRGQQRRVGQNPKADRVVTLIDRVFSPDLTDFERIEIASALNQYLSLLIEAEPKPRGRRRGYDMEANAQLAIELSARLGSDKAAILEVIGPSTEPGDFEQLQNAMATRRREGASAIPIVISKSLIDRLDTSRRTTPKKPSKKRP